MRPFVIEQEEEKLYRVACFMGIVPTSKQISVAIWVQQINPNFWESVMAWVYLRWHGHSIHGAGTIRIPGMGMKLLAWAHIVLGIKKQN